MRHALKAFAILCFLTALPGLAQAQSTDDKIRAILEMGDFNRGVDVGFDSMRPMMIEQLKRATPKMTPELADYVGTIAKEEVGNIKPQLLDFAVKFLKTQLTDEEVTALYDFYRTPTGSILARKMNGVMGNLMVETQKFMSTTFGPRLVERLKSDPKLQSALAP
ncbi:DUF2059 domain-containing protein [Microvirga flavescens]|uniref:DUF2059 domain-containing protein n=1 Tax=Microvirga flavescens TaxID=2249811 RepID=UPI000DD77925|nr:DUF2059 domain-containing protein [Microvirga flavescens]